MRMLFFAFIALTLLPCAPARATEGTEGTINLPAFTVQDLSHRDLRKGVVILNIFASWCVPCAAEMPILENLSKKIPVYGIAYRDNPAMLRTWLDKNGNPFIKIGHDASGMDTKPLGLYGVPTTLVIRKNKIIFRLDGPLTPDQEEKILRVAGIE